MASTPAFWSRRRRRSMPMYRTRGKNHASLSVVCICVVPWLPGVFHMRLLDGAVELERRLVVVLQPHRRAEVNTEVEAVVGGETERGADGHHARGDLLAVDFQDHFERA